MRVKIAKFAGFCHGVEQTIEMIEKLLREKKERVSCIGLPVHNKQVTDKLIDEGLNVVKSIEDIGEGILVVRAHGLPPKIIEKAYARGLEIVDTTCNIVKRAQKYASILAEEGYQIVITGEEKHPEVKSLYGFAMEKAQICNSSKDTQLSELSGRIGIVSQTTFSKKTYDDIVAKLLNNNVAELRVFDTICRSMQRRNCAAIECAQNVDCMFVVGGKMSSNTKRLFEASKSVNDKTFHIETISDIDVSILEGIREAGLTAGASTPQWLIEEVVEYLKSK